MINTKSKLDHFRLAIQSLGNGARGDIYAAKNTRNNHVRAIKLAQAKCAYNSELREEIIEEFDLHSCLQHPNIVRIYSWSD
jgi:serine/threonine protein kinase